MGYFGLCILQYVGFGRCLGICKRLNFVGFGNYRLKFVLYVGKSVGRNCFGSWIGSLWYFIGNIGVMCLNYVFVYVWG